MVCQIDLNSQELQCSLEKIVAAGGSHRLSIRLQTFEELQRLDLTSSCSSTGTLASDSGAVVSEGSEKRSASDRQQVNCESNPSDAHVYLTASYTKVAINLLMLLVLKEKHINLDHNAQTLYNSYRSRRSPRLPPVHLKRNPTIRRLLSHIDGFPSMAELLFASDDTDLLTIEEFLSASHQEAGRYYTKTDNLGEAAVQYGNTNHIFAAKIIELIAQKPIEAVAREMLFRPLGMEKSALGWKEPGVLGNVVGLLPGYQVNSSREHYNVSVQTQLEDSVVLPSLGLRCSPDDVAKLNHALLRALHGCDESLLTRSDAENFMIGTSPSLAGSIARVSKDKPTLKDFISESPNRHLDDRTHHFKRCVRLRSDWTKNDSDSGHHDFSKNYPVCYKSGYFDGYGCAVFVMPQQSTFFIVMDNSTGPLDTVHYVSWHLLQEILEVVDPVNVPAEAVMAAQRCTQALAQLEAKNLVAPSDTFVPWPELAGVYQGDVKEQRLTISRGGDVFFHGASSTPTRGSGGDAVFRAHSKRSSAMKLMKLGDDRFRVLLDRRCLTIEGWSTWANMDFAVQQNAGGLQLVRTSRIDGIVFQQSYRRVADWFSS